MPWKLQSRPRFEDVGDERSLRAALCPITETQ
jgi:hypothetical protein